MLPDAKELGQAPEPKQRLLEPVTRLLDESDDKYPPVSPEVVTITLLLT